MTTGRFAPSPSGPLHLGNLRTALVAWLAARHAGGRFLLRVEDLTTGAAPVAEAGQLADLAALGLDHDGPVVRQSARRAHHDAALARLTAAGRTYPCTCTRAEVRAEVAAAGAAPHDAPADRYPGTCRTRSAAETAARVAAGRVPSLRLRAEGLAVTTTDRRLGTRADEVDDFVLRRGDGVVAYNLAVVVDDAAQGVDQVVRGDDLWPTTHRQVALQQLLGLPTPEYLHVPLVVGPDGHRLAKRHGAVTLADQVAAGLDAVAVRAALARSLGLAGPLERPELATLLERFDPDALPSAPWVLAP